MEGFIMKDTLGRENRTLVDKACAECNTTFRPRRASSKYCSRQCVWANNGGQNKQPETWWLNQKGYLEGKVWIEGKQVRRKKHRWIMEQYLGRALDRNEIIHHINGDRLDNRTENLKLTTNGKHTTYHNLLRQYKKS